jgi:hypothetical protein
MFLLLLDKYKVKINNVVFGLAFIAYFVSLFLGDIYQVDGMIGDVSRYLRMLTYGLSLLAFVMAEFKRKAIWKIALVVAVSVLFLVVAKEAYLISMLLLVYAGREFNINRLFNLSFAMLFVGTAIVLSLMLVDQIPDFMTSHAFSDDMSRHSFGFYHSDVLPGIVVFLQVFYVWTRKHKVSFWSLFAFTGLHLVVYHFCHSRACLAVGVALSVFQMILKRNYKSKLLCKAVNFTTKYIAVFCGMLSILGMFIVTKFEFMHKIDLLFSYRLISSSWKMNRVGLKIINLMHNNEFYGNDSFVVDNGYLFIALRFGLIILIGLFVISFLLQKRYKNDLFVESCLMAVFVLAFIDNDFLSYGFLPILIAAVNVNTNERKRGYLYGAGISLDSNEHL